MAGSGFAAQSLFKVSNKDCDPGLGVDVTVVTKTSSFTLGTAMDVALIDATSGPVIVTLPVAANAAGKLFWIKKIDNSANLVTVATYGAEKLDNYDSLALCDEGHTVQIVSDACNWWII